MKQTAGFISTYTADVFGVCSALYELGGMTIMHDASGCNSTYHTHDEPRWYDMNSMVYISALSEMEAIMGDDTKLIQDITDAALDLHPKFIAIAGTPIPAMIGTDFPAIANIIEQKTNIPCFGFTTTGMNSYISGVSMALDQIALRFVHTSAVQTKKPSLNILGATPIDFSINGSVNAMRDKLDAAGFEVVSCWAMGSSFEELTNAGKAQVNLVVSSTGLLAAQTLRKMFGTPYVVGSIVGEEGLEHVIKSLQAAIKDKKDRIAYQDHTAGSEVVNEVSHPSLENVNSFKKMNRQAVSLVMSQSATKLNPDTKRSITLIGELVTTASLAHEIEAVYGCQTRILCPLPTDTKLLRHQDRFCCEEDDLIQELKDAKFVIADPMYAPICPDDATLIPLPHEACSGRLYRNDIPNLVTGFYQWAKEALLHK